MPDAQTHFTMFGVVLLTSTLIALANARIYERCELARDLLRFGVKRDDVATWVCIAFHESRFDTAARNPHSGDHGLLQISELYWCGPGKACGVPCSAFRNEDIYDDVQCALRIHEEHTRLQGNGFLAWVVYPHHCKHNAKKYIVDCDTSAKHAKFDNRARQIKTFERNVTNAQSVSYRDIDSLKPPYLAINELFKGHYINEFEKDYYNNKRPLNWLNFKIDNIDNLKLPDLTKKGTYEFTTPPASTTILYGIKPPSPRKIESNQFRKRMMNLDIISTKSNDKNDFVFRKSFGEIAPTNNVYVEIDLSENPFINFQKISSTDLPSWKKGASSSPNYINNFVATTPRTITSTGRATSSQKSVSTHKHNISLHTTTPSTITPRTGKSRHVLENNSPGYSILPRPTTTTATTTTSTNSTPSPIVAQLNDNHSSKVNVNYNISMNSSNRSEQRTLKSLKTATHSNDNKSLQIMENKSTTPSFGSSFEKIQIYERTPKIVTTNRSIEMSGSSTRFSWDSSRYVQTVPTEHPQAARTTRRRAFTQTTLAPNTTTTEKIISSTRATPVFTQTSTGLPPTVRSTQSIFDLYLNPTKATLRPFTFSSFENSPFKVRIFSGGTTPAPGSHLAAKKLRR